MVFGNIFKENPYGQVGGWVVLSGKNTTSWLHLASWNLPDSQLSWESKMEPSVAIREGVKWIQNNGLFHFLCMKQDRNETWFKILGKTEARPRVLVSFFARPRWEPSFNEENDWILASFVFKTTHPDQDKTKQTEQKWRPRWDCLKKFHPRRNQDTTASKV